MFTSNFHHPAPRLLSLSHFPFPPPTVAGRHRRKIRYILSTSLIYKEETYPKAIMRSSCLAKLVSAFSSRRSLRDWQEDV